MAVQTLTNKSHYQITRQLCWAFFLISTISCTANNSTNTPSPTLKDAFRGQFLIGIAVNERQFTEADPKAVQLITNNFNSISPENVLKWQSVHPSPETYTFDMADKFVEFGLKHNMVIIGHTLVWHHQTPLWVFQNEKGEKVDRETLIARMRDHIHTVVGRYKGKIKGWDVVNEALNENGQLRRSRWLEIIGPDYIKLAFKFAHEADPDVELYYNDYSIENEPKRRGAIEIVKSLKAEGIRIDAVGMQGHYLMNWPTLQQIENTINDFKKLGVKVMITELDIDVLPRVEGHLGGGDIRTIRITDPQRWHELDPYPDGLPEEKQDALAQRYAELFKVFLKHHDTISRVTFWGLTDGESWLNYNPVPGRHNHPLLFDRQYKPKKAYYAIIRAAQEFESSQKNKDK